MGCGLRGRLLGGAYDCDIGSKKDELWSFLEVVLGRAPKGLVGFEESPPEHVSERETCACEVSIQG